MRSLVSVDEALQLLPLVSDQRSLVLRGDVLLQTISLMCAAERWSGRRPSPEVGIRVRQKPLARGSGIRGPICLDYSISLLDCSRELRRPSKSLRVGVVFVLDRGPLTGTLKTERVCVLHLPSPYSIVFNVNG